MPDFKISLIHPSRGRPVKSREAAAIWRLKAGVSVEYILSLDDDNHKEYTGLFLGNVIVNKNRSAIDAINNAAKIATGDILVQMADDFDCPENWGLKILEATQGKTDWVLKTQDGLQPWMITLPIMDRTYYNRFGYVYNPEYLHMFCDTELSCVADLTGRRITSDLMFRHNHYSTVGDKRPQDETSRRADATWNQGEKVFLERYRRNFDLKLKDMPGKITDQNYLRWIASKS